MKVPLSGLPLADFEKTDDSKSPIKRDFEEVDAMKEIMDFEKVFLAVLQIQRNLGIETVAELERIGLKRICIKNNIDYDDLTEAEKEELWKELTGIVEEIEFKKKYAEMYMNED